MKEKYPTSKEYQNEELALEYYASLITEVYLDMEIKKHPDRYSLRSIQSIRDSNREVWDRWERRKQ